MVYKKAQKDSQMHFMAVKKSIKRSGLRYMYILKKVHLQELKRDAKFKTRYVKVVPLVNRR